MRISCARFVWLVVALVLSLVPASAVWAQSLLFQRGDSLYTATEAGKDPRKLWSVGGAADTLWAAAPDGRRIAVLMRGAAKNGETKGLENRPITITVSDISGRHRKRLLTTETLKDRQGRRINRLTKPAGAAPTIPDDPDASRLNDWEPVSLAWSADSRTLYLSCFYNSDPGGKATFAVDAITGTALIDGDGRWKSIAPVTHIAARGALLVGSGFSRYTPQGSTPVAYQPLITIVLTSGEQSVLYIPERGDKVLPEQAFATNPALGPENRQIAFASVEKGIYITDKFGKTYRRLVEGGAIRPRWSSDGERLYFLLPRPLTEEKPVFDLYSLPVPETADALPDAPTLIQQSVTWFDIVP